MLDFTCFGVFGSWNEFEYQRCIRAAWLTVIVASFKVLCADFCPGCNVYFWSTLTGLHVFRCGAYIGYNVWY